MFNIKSSDNYRVLDSSQETLDSLYEKYRNDSTVISRVEVEFISIISTINRLNINFDANKRLCWTTHLYSLFTLAWLLNKQKKMDDNIGIRINGTVKNYAQISLQTLAE